MSCQMFIILIALDKENVRAILVFRSARHSSPTTGKVKSSYICSGKPPKKGEILARNQNGYSCFLLRLINICQKLRN